MKRQSKLLNLIGQLRIYSLIDLFLFAFALKSDISQILGIFFLHLGFLLYLEFIHKHKNRVPFPKFLWIIFIFIGVFFYKDIALVGFLVCSVFYTMKTMGNWGWASPVFRGLQYYFLAAGIVGFLNPISLLSFLLLVIRNFAGDLRDVTKDTAEGMKTLPIILGIKSDFKYIHLITLLGTTSVWLYISDISAMWLVPVYFIQIINYNLTSR